MSSDSEHSIEPAAASLLDKLRAPTQSETCRKRSLLVNPPKGQNSSSGRHKLKEPRVLPSERVKEFPNEDLTVSVGRLFCNSCRETISVKRSTVTNHVRSTKHNESKVVMTLMRAGIPLCKLDYLRDLLEEKALRLADTRHMHDLIPFVLDTGKRKIKEESER